MRRVFLLTVLLCCLPLFSQEFKLGGVTLEELKETSYPFDKDAEAAYLYKKGETHFDVAGGRFRTITEVQVRLKIYTKAGYDYAAVKIPYYAGRTSQKVKFTDVCTYNLVNGAIEKTKLNAEGKFDEEVTEDFKIKKIILPNVKEGSIIEYRYVITNPFMAISDWPFQYEIPVKNIEYEVAIPHYFEYAKHIKGYVDVSSYEKPSRWGSHFREYITVYKVKNVPAFKDEAYVDNIENYMSILDHDMTMFQIPGQRPVFFATDWHMLCTHIYDEEAFGTELELKGYFEKDIDALLKDVPKENKLDTLFGFVRDRMAWNEQESEFCYKGVKKAYEEKTGNTAEINFTLTAILRYAGFDANPVLLSTRENGAALYPSASAFNYVVAGVKVNNEMVLLDATSKNTLPGLLPVRALNWVGWIIKSRVDSFEVDLMPKKKSVEMVTITGEIDAQGKITGKARDQYSHHAAFIFREEYKEEHKEKYVEVLEKHYPGIEINDYKALNLKDLEKPAGDDYSFVHNSIADVVGDKIYVSPMLYFAQKENPFTAEDRKYPIDFVFPQQSKYMIGLKIPEGYSVEALPESKSFVMEENIGSFKYIVKQVGNIIQANIIFEINYANIKQDYYPVLKDFFRKMIEKQNEKIILKKA